MVSTVLAEFSRHDLLNLSVPPQASITDVNHLSSYNWIEEATPTIAVLGSPRLWSAPIAPRQLNKDSGLIYIAQNAARHPESPLEPLFRALYITEPSFNIRSIDIVTDRNNIRKLLLFINPSSTSYGLETFTINIEVVKNTAILCRDETAIQKLIGPHEFRGFGHEFEKAYTKSQISHDTGHHQILSYRFGDLNFLIRRETDRYVAGKAFSDSKEPNSDSLSNILESLSLSSTKTPPSTTPAGSKLTIKEEAVAPQLWISQTPKLVRAYHQKGKFQKPEVEDVAALIKKWEERDQTDLRKLAALISKILEVVKGSGGNAVVKYDDQEDKLVVWKSEGNKMLPKDLYSKWDDEGSSGVEAAAEQETAAESVIMPVDELKAKAEQEGAEFAQEDTRFNDCGVGGNQKAALNGTLIVAAN